MEFSGQRTQKVCMGALCAVSSPSRIGRRVVYLPCIQDGSIARQRASTISHVFTRLTLSGLYCMQSAVTDFVQLRSEVKNIVGNRYGTTAVPHSHTAGAANVQLFGLREGGRLRARRRTQGQKISNWAIRWQF